MVFFIQAAADMLWNPWLLGGFLLVGGVYTLRSRFFQFRVPIWLRHTVFAKNARKGPGGLTQIQALSTALASTIGTGSIAGVATAIFFGGPGAVFWMWVSAILGMMTSFGEKALAVAFRQGGEGGPMEYMRKGLPKLGKPLALLFSTACLFASLGGGAMVQANSIAAALHAAFSWPILGVGIVTALLVGAVIFGGLGQIGKVSEKLVPVMALFFLGGGFLALYVCRGALPAAFRAILDGAFRPKAVFGGYSMGLALRYGVARGVFTNEAGLGSSAMAHAAAQVDHPAREGMWGIFEVGVATLCICTVTALVILTTGVYDPAQALAYLQSGFVPPEMIGAPLSAAAFGTVFGAFGPVFVAVCLILFAFTSLLGWSYYGQQALCFLCGSRRPVPAFRLAYLLAVCVGAAADPVVLWALADLCDALMALPNLTALLLLSPKALQLLEDFLGSNRGKGKKPGENLAAGRGAKAGASGAWVTFPIAKKEDI